MPKSDAVMEELIGYWHQAFKSPHGLRLESPDRQFLINQLYHARQVTLDEDLDTLSIVKDATDETVIWIVRKADATVRPGTGGEG